jgi:hypothetical protein
MEWRHLTGKGNTAHAAFRYDGTGDRKLLRARSSSSIMHLFLSLGFRLRLETQCNADTCVHAVGFVLASSSHTVANKLFVLTAELETTSRVNKP